MVSVVQRLQRSPFKIFNMSNAVEKGLHILSLILNWHSHISIPYSQGSIGANEINTNWRNGITKVYILN